MNRDHDVAIFKKLDARADELRVERLLDERILTLHFEMKEKKVLWNFGPRTPPC